MKACAAGKSIMFQRKRIGPFGADPFLKSCFHFCLSEDTLLCVLQNRDLCVIFVINMFSVVFLRLCNDDAGKQQHRDNIRDRHQSVQKIGSNSTSRGWSRTRK